MSGPTTTALVNGDATAVVGDVIDFSLDPDGWTGPFGFVTLRLREGLFNGSSVWFVRTDTSDAAYAAAEKLVFVPKIAPMAGASSGKVYVVDGAADQPPVFSTEPGKPDYTPAWTLHRVTWSGSPKRLGSVAEIEAAAASGALSIEATSIVVNAGIVSWSGGSMAVDSKKEGYLGEGMLLEAPDKANGRVTFKLGQCYPGSRYFVLDHSIGMAAEMTKTTFSPRLHGLATKASATGRTNVFMNGLKGPGPMGFQPSAFDFKAGDAAWSPYWDHYTYAWKDGKTARLLTSQTEVHQARDAGDLDEFPGVPDTKGEVFTVNCPVPVLAPVSFKA
ncbi:MAG: DUF7482 domain-containing protein [Acidimicrobiales bacterium]